MGKDRFEDLDFIDFNDSRRQEGTVIADMLSAVYRNRKWLRGEKRCVSKFGRSENI